MTTDEALAEIEDAASRSPTGELQEAVEVIRAELKRGKDEPDPSLSDAYLSIIRLTTELSDAKAANSREQQARANSYLEICRLEAALAAATARAEQLERERDAMVLAAARLAQYDEFCPMDEWGVVPATIEHIRDRITDDGSPEIDAEWVQAVRAAANLTPPAATPPASDPAHDQRERTPSE